MTFLKPTLLYLLWIVPVAGAIWVWVARHRPLADARFVTGAMAARLLPPPDRARFAAQLALLLTGALLALLAAARPTWGARPERVYQRGRDLIVALDVSRSMLARDVHPSRLGRAKADLQDLARILRGDRVGLVAFRGKAITLCPLTTDYAFFSQLLDSAGVESAPAGETDIGMALDRAVEAFDATEGAHRAVVLVSDGEDLAGRSKEAAQRAREKGVVVFTVGLGSTAGAVIPAGAEDTAPMTYNNQDVVSHLNHETLREIAEITGGAYVPVGQSRVQLGALYRDHLSRLQARDLQESITQRRVDRFQWLLLPAILAWLAMLALSRGQPLLRRLAAPITPHSPLTTPAVIVLLIAGTLQAQTNDTAATDDSSSNITAGSTAYMPDGVAGNSRDLARDAQRQAALHNYRAAADSYLRAASNATAEAAADYLYNAGCALFDAGQFAPAAELFRQQLSRGDKPAPASLRNLGASLTALAERGNSATNPVAASETRAHSLAQAADAYRRALRAAPDTGKTRADLAVVAARLPEAREQARIAALMEKHGQTPAPQIADQLLTEERQVTAAAEAAATNLTPSRVAQLEEAARLQRQAADLIVPLKAKLIEALKQQTKATNMPSPEAIAGYIESVRDHLDASAARLRDLEPDAPRRAADGEAAIYRLWKGVASHEMALREGLRRQTNAIALTQHLEHEPDGRLRGEQQETLDLTQIFSNRFAQAVPPEGLPAPPPKRDAAAPNDTPAAPNTNMLISAETRAKILKLADEAVATQCQALATLKSSAFSNALPQERKSHDLLTEIAKLLPPPPPQEQNQKQDDRQDQKQQDQKQSQTNAPAKPPPKPDKPQPQPKPQTKPGEMTPEQIQKMLDEARQREKEHQDEARDRNNTLPAVGRDW